MNIKYSLYLLFMFIGLSCKNSECPDAHSPETSSCIPLDLIGEYYLQGYFHYPNSSQQSDLYTTNTNVGGNAFPNAISGDLVLNSDNTCSNTFQVVFKRDSVSIDTIQKDIMGNYSESHIEGDCDYIYHEGSIVFSFDNTIKSYEFSKLCRDIEGIPILMRGRIEQDSVLLYYYPK